MGGVPALKLDHTDVVTLGQLWGRFPSLAPIPIDHLARKFNSFLPPISLSSFGSRDLLNGLTLLNIY